MNSWIWEIEIGCSWNVWLKMKLHTALILASIAIWCQKSAQRNYKHLHFFNICEGLAHSFLFEFSDKISGWRWLIHEWLSDEDGWYMNGHSACVQSQKQLITVNLIAGLNRAWCSSHLSHQWSQFRSRISDPKTTSSACKNNAWWLHSS